MKKINGIMIKYEVGDTIKIKSRDWYFLSRKPGENYVSSLGISFGPDHAQFCGQTAKITWISSENPYRISACKLDIDKGAYLWNDIAFCEIFALEQMEAIENGRD